jgi:hypothetical protein
MVTARPDDHGRGTSESPLVSIVINNFNYRRFLKQSIESALAQTYAHVEVVVADDASTDGSQELIRGYGDRVTPVLQADNGGQGAAMNAGAAACRGDLIIFLDADDYLYPSAAQSVAEAYRPDVALIQYRLHLVDEGGRVLDQFPRPELNFDTGDVRRKLLDTGRFEGTVTSGQAFARRALDSVLPIPAQAFRISADGYLLSTVPFHGNIVAIEQPLGAYRLHGSNLWSSATGAGSFRRSLAHDAAKHREVRARAAMLGLLVAERVELRDYQHLSSRLASLVLEPAQHPYPEDSRLALGVRGALAARKASLRAVPRLLLALWFVAAGALPRSWSRRVVGWRYEHQSRPAGLRRVVGWIRRT